jgi:hypothetical protein
MKKLTTEFVIDHLDDHFMIGINALYWMGDTRSSMVNVLEEEEYPTFSELFYKQYGSFSPLNPDLAIEDIRNEECSIDFLDVSVNWEDFVIDVIGFFHHSNCPDEVKMNIKDHFFDHYEYISMVDDNTRETEAKKIFNDYNDSRVLMFFEFRDYLNMEVIINI